VLKLSPIVVAATLFVSNGAFAAEEKVTSVDELAQVTSVSQLSDVQPSDWAFQSVQSLVERYGCIAGYPDGTFKGNRALTRYEFAAGLNACLERITQLIAAGTTVVPEADMEAIDRLAEEFNDELIGVIDRINGLDARAAKIEANQFSTTAKLRGEALFAVSDVFGAKDSNDKIGNGGNGSNTVFSNRVRLGISTSFNGKDNLSLRLQARNTPQFDGGSGTARPNITGTNMTRLGFDGATADGGRNVEMDKLSYSFKPSDKLSVKIDAVGAAMDDNVNNYNPVFASSGGGAISRYGRFNPIYRVASGQSAVTANLGKSNSRLRLNAGYVTNNATDNTKGIFEGDNTFFGQVDLKPTKKLNVGVAYARAYRAGGSGLFGSTGSGNANSPFKGQATTATTANVYSLLANYQLNSKTTLAGWYGFADADAGTNDANINYWAANLGFKDFGAKGNTLGVIFGQPPKVTKNSVAKGEDKGTSYHLEGLYKMRVNDRIDVTPGLLVIFNPEHNEANKTVYVGTLRTTFKF